MTVLNVLKMGHPVLQVRALPVQAFSTASLKTLIHDMTHTMQQEGGVGIAAPQIGVSLRVMVFGFEKNARYPDAPPVPKTVLINPEIRHLHDEMEDGWEGCLSVPGLRGLVPRYKAIEYSGYTVEGKFFSQTAEGFHARIVQHELDHLDGILYPQKIKDLKFFGFSDTVQWQHKA